MPPKKTNSRPNTAPGKEDDRLNSSQRSNSAAASGGNNNSLSTINNSSATGGAGGALDFGLSSEEKEFLHQQKEWFAKDPQQRPSTAATATTNMLKTPPAPVPLTPSNAAAVAAAAASKSNQQWQTEVLPKLKGIVEKVLQVAATHYAQEYADYVEAHKAELAAASPGGDGGKSDTTANTTVNAKSGRSSGTISRPGQASSTDVATHKLTPPTPPAGTPENFVEENEYLLSQLAQMEWAPFTMQRLLELLERPAEFHSTSSGKLRGGALQSSLRRCLLVMCSFNPVDTIPAA